MLQFFYQLFCIRHCSLDIFKLGKMLCIRLMNYLFANLLKPIVELGGIQLHEIIDSRRQVDQVADRLFVDPNNLKGSA